MVTCFISIGSNLGDRQYYINTAIRKIMMLMATRVRKISRIIETVPQGGPLQGPYLNAVLEIDTDLSPYQLLQELQNIESYLGRVRTVKNAARTIDLDIITYGQISLNEAALCIPHPRLMERTFVLEPLREIAPEVAKKLERRIIRLSRSKAKTTVKRSLTKTAVKKSIKHTKTIRKKMTRRPRSKIR